MTKTEIQILIDVCEDEIRRNASKIRTNNSLISRMRKTNEQLLARNKFLAEELKRYEALMDDVWAGKEKNDLKEK